MSDEKRAWLLSLYWSGDSQGKKWVMLTETVDEVKSRILQRIQAEAADGLKDMPTPTQYVIGEWEVDYRGEWSLQFEVIASFYRETYTYYVEEIEVGS